MYQRLKPFGNNALLLEWNQQIDVDILTEITYIVDKLNEEDLIGIVDIIPAYASLMIVFMPEKISFHHLSMEISNYLNSYTKKNVASGALWNISVKYHAADHKDMAYLMDRNKLTREQVVELHSNVIYNVFFIGFLPGFMYLGGLDSRLQIPRKTTPELRIPSGSVAIGGNQTGVYPQESPGGWHVIGHSDFTFFEPKKPPYCPIKAGDRVKFVPV